MEKSGSLEGARATSLMWKVTKTGVPGNDDEVLKRLKYGPVELMSVCFGY